MTIVIPLLNYTTNNFQELRYCLRGVERFHPECEVMIVGVTIPNWCRNVSLLPVCDYPHPEFKERTIHEKIMRACDAIKKEEFIYMNDDFFLMSPVDYVHHKGRMITERRKRSPYSSYGKTLDNTMDLLGYKINLYGTHAPLIINKSMYEAVNQLDWNKPFGYCFKTSYVQLNGFHGEHYPDLKFNTEIGDVEGRLYFSTNDNCDLSRLKDIYPDKSKYEI